MLKRSVLLFVAFSLSLIVNANAQLTPGEQSDNLILSNLSSMPLAFTENQGQFGDKTLFKANAGGATFYFCPDEVAYLFVRDTDELIEDDAFGRPDMPGMPDEIGGRQTSSSAPYSDAFNHPRYKKESMLIKAQFIGANPNPEVIGTDRLPHNNNYFYGNDPSKWRTDVPNYSAIIYKDIYPGIDLKYYGNGNSMKYDFIVNPGADLSQIAIRYEGVDDLSISNNGDLQLNTTFGFVYENKPYVYQDISGRKVELEAEYYLKKPGVFGFNVDVYNSSLPLVIDPELVYSTYLGGGHYEYGTGITVDDSGNAYVTGYTWSDDFPIVDPHDGSFDGMYDVFVSKLSDTGNSLVYSTYLGGSAYEECFGIAVDDAGNAYVTGYTTSNDFPIVDYYDGSLNGENDVFVTKLSSEGNSLVYNTYLGGSLSECGLGIALNESGNAYVTGWTNSSNFPIENPYQIHQLYDDVFVTKLSPTGNSLDYSTYLGGNNMEGGYGIDVDVDGSAYVTGYTKSVNFPTENPYSESLSGSRDVFVTRLSSSGNLLSFSTYLGGDGYNDYGYGIRVDNSGCAYVTGWTQSDNFPIVNSYCDSLSGSGDVFVTKLSSGGNLLVYSTYLGGISYYDKGYGIAIDGGGSAYITGVTQSNNFPVVNPYDGSFNGGGRDVFVAKFGPETGGEPDCFLSGIWFSDNNYNAISDLLDIVAIFENQSTEPVNDVAVSVYIDDDPIQLSLGDRDLDEDSKIDVIEPGWDTLLIASYQLPSNSWENHSLRIEVTEIDGEPVNQEIMKTISCYFAQKIENSLPDPFDLREDAYSFPNSKPRLSDLKALISTKCHVFPIELVNYLFSLWGARSGKCYGLASTCYWYFEEPERKPQPLEVFEMEEDDPGVFTNIMDYYLMQKLDEDIGDYQPPVSVEPECRGYVASGKPILVQMRGGPPDNIAYHAVSAFKIIADHEGDSTYIMIYDNNYPSDGDPDSRTYAIALIDLQQNAFKYPVGTLEINGTVLPEGYYYNLAVSIPPDPLITILDCNIVDLSFGILSQMIDVIWDIRRAILNITCPVRGYVIDELGQRSGYLSPDITVNEIPGVEFLAIHEGPVDSMISFMLPVGKSYELHLWALEEGSAEITLVYPLSDSAGNLASFEEVYFFEQSTALFSFDSLGFGQLEMDFDGDGQPDTLYQPIDNIHPVIFDLIYPLDENLDQDTVLFIWGNSYDLDSEDSIFFRLYLAEDSLFSDADSVDIAGDSTFVWREDLTTGEKYWRVRSIDSRGLYTDCLTPYGRFFIGSGCDYVIGDFNGNGAFNVADIISAFSKLKTGSPDPGMVCECPPGGGIEWAVAMDVNNSCVFNIADVIAGFSKLTAGEPELVPCEDCPPSGWSPAPGGEDKPPTMPRLESKAKINKSSLPK